jgi:hypothetical protein
LATAILEREARNRWAGRILLLPLAAGEMSDAGEVLLAIYGRIEALRPAAAQALAVVFGLGVQEYVYCDKCNMKSHSHSYTQYFYNTQVRFVWYSLLGHASWLIYSAEELHGNEQSLSQGS